MKILVLEPQIIIADFIKRSLERNDYEVEMVPDDEDGYRRILGGAYDLVILDIVLKKIDGLTLVRELRDKNTRIPVLILTGNSDIDDIVAGFEAGADGYMKKPFDFAELLARVKALQRRSEQERGAKLHFAGIHLDPVSHKVWFNETLIKLTEKEYDLLHFFLRHPNQVVTRNMLAEEVWQAGLGSFTNVIEVYVNYLRNKIFKVMGNKLIHTVRGVGYILEEG